MYGRVRLEMEDEGGGGAVVEHISNMERDLLEKLAFCWYCMVRKQLTQTKRWTRRGNNRMTGRVMVEMRAVKEKKKGNGEKIIEILNICIQMRTIPLFNIV